VRNRRALPLRQGSQRLFLEASIISTAGHKNDQHEFTPTGQDNLEKWSDMITINVYSSANDGDALAVEGERGSGKLQKPRRPGAQN